jgi:hypothetical protein
LKKLKLNIVLVFVILGIILLTYLSYYAGYQASKNNMDTLLMTMTIDSNLVTTGLYEELPNNVRKTMHFYIEDTPSLTSDVKIFAEVKYVTIEGKTINTEDGKIWNLLKTERIFQRKFNDTENSDTSFIPNSPYAENNINLQEQYNLL